MVTIMIDRFGNDIVQEPPTEAKETCLLDFQSEDPGFGDPSEVGE